MKTHIPKIPGRPGGFYLLRRKRPAVQNQIEELTILVELDDATHPLKRFITRKVKPAVKCIGSNGYLPEASVNIR